MITAQTRTGADKPTSANLARLLNIFLLMLIVLFAASLRLRAALETVAWPPLQGDSVDYVSAAYNLRQFGVFSHMNTWSPPVTVAPKPDALLEPGYPAVLAVLLPEYPNPPFLRRLLLLQALLGVLTVCLVYPLTAQLLPKPAALAATALVAFNPQLIALGASVLTETVFTLLVTAALCALVRAVLRGSMAWYAMAGVFIGLSALVRPTLEFLPLVLLPALAWFLPRPSWKPCLALLLGMTLTFGPWIVRNELVTGASSDPTLMTNTLLHGSYPDMMYHADPRSLAFPYRFDPQSSRIKTPGQALARIRENFVADPSGTLRWYMLSKPLRFFDWGFLEGSGGIFINTTLLSPYLQGQRAFVLSYAAMYFLHWPLVALGFCGILMALRGAIARGRDPAQAAMGVLAVTMIFVIGLHMIGFPLGRYSVPFRPLTYLLAMFAVVMALRWLRTRWQRR